MEAKAQSFMCSYNRCELHAFPAHKQQGAASSAVCVAAGCGSGALPAQESNCCLSHGSVAAEHTPARADESRPVTLGAVTLVLPFPRGPLTACLSLSFPSCRLGHHRLRQPSAAQRPARHRLERPRDNRLQCTEARSKLGRCRCTLCLPLCVCWRAGTCCCRSQPPSRLLRPAAYPATCPSLLTPPQSGKPPKPFMNAGNLNKTWADAFKAGTDLVCKESDPLVSWLVQAVGYQHTSPTSIHAQGVLVLSFLHRRPGPSERGAAAAFWWYGG